MINQVEIVRLKFHRKKDECLKKSEINSAEVVHQSAIHANGNQSRQIEERDQVAVLLIIENLVAKVPEEEEGQAEVVHLTERNQSLGQDLARGHEVMKKGDADETLVIHLLAVKITEDVTDLTLVIIDMIHIHPDQGIMVILIIAIMAIIGIIIMVVAEEEVGYIEVVQTIIIITTTHLAHTIMIDHLTEDTLVVVGDK